MPRPFSPFRVSARSVAAGVLLLASSTLAACRGGDGAPLEPGGGVPLTVQILNGDGQQDTVGRPLPQLLHVEVTRSGAPARDVAVHFRVVEPTGCGRPVAAVVRTNAAGVALGEWTEATRAGECHMVVSTVNARTNATTLHDTLVATFVPGAIQTLHGTTVPALRGAASTLLPLETHLLGAEDVYGNTIGATELPRRLWWAIDELTSATRRPMSDAADPSELDICLGLCIVIPGTLTPGAHTLYISAGTSTGGAVTQLVIPLVIDPIPVDKVFVTPLNRTFPAQGDLQLTAMAYDRRGRPLPDAPVTWESLSPEEIAVSATGRLTAAYPSDVEIVARTGDVAATVLATAQFIGNDGTPPRLLSATFAPSTVAVSQRDATVVVTLVVADDESGVPWGSTSASFTGPGGPGSGQSSLAGFCERAGGTARQRTLACSVRIRQGAAAGDWNLDFISVLDRAGNSARYFPADLALLPGARVLHVTP